MDAVIYIRWSSAEQGRGSSLERQQEECRRHAALKGWNVIAEMIDDGVSAFKGQHAAVGELGRFVAGVEVGAYPDGVVLLAENLDRLSREQAKKVFAWMYRVTELGVIVATVEGDRRYDRDNLNMAAIIEVIVKAQLANEESEKKASRLSAAWASKRGRLAGGERIVLTSRAPAWLRVEGSPPRFAVVDDRAATIRRIFRDTVAGLGKHHIARNLNLDGIETFGRAKGWHGSYVQKILNSAAVLGEFQPGRKPRGERRTAVGEAVVDYYPRIVDADLHAAATRAISGRQRRVAGRGRRLTNLFSGLATCGECGSKMTFRGKGLRRRADGTEIREDYLVCDSYQRGCGCGNGHHFNYADWSSGVLTAILHAAMSDRHFSSPDVVRPIEIEIAESVRVRTATNARAENALALHLETGRAEPKAKWLEAAREVDEHDVTIRRLQARLVEARGAVSPEEHLRRIQALQNTLEDDDDQIRFVARSRVMEAVHELVATMVFSKTPLQVMLATKDGIAVQVGWEDRGEGPIMASTAWTMDGAARWPARYNPPDYVQPD
ncbi:recombinase family protein [uncultured Sphingomonas sp.]|uniref:recombinase family protein n=1 Tax=uncultured Sphingomonas sp. TaxID=158754 RepID=UPI0035CC6409